VGASNASGGPSCFSNQGDVYAPGGDGIVANSCALPDCQSPTPDNFVVGPVYGYPDSSGYAYWLGTSFAAPWVSGLAALLQQGEGPWIPPQVGRAARISDTIRGCAVANANSVVDMASSLATPPICQAPPGKIEVSLSGMAVCPTSPP
jgi:subtilisin family serine protease